MAQQTQVFVLEGGEGRALGDRLSRAGYSLRPAPHARFLAQGEGITATLYESGKLVVQGQDLEGWTVRFLSASAASAPAPANKKTASGGLPAGDTAAIGSDEAGKGDTFGGMVVCAAAWPEGGHPALLKAGLADSKQIADERIRALAPHIRDNLVVAEIALRPAEYNKQHAAAGANVNKLLARLHVDVLQQAGKKSDIRLAIVDRFSSQSPVSAVLRQKPGGWKVVEVPRAEKHPAVAAASVLAREAFIRMIKTLEEEWAVDLPLGSGAPVGPALRRFIQIHGTGAIGQVAKLHFRNVQKVL